MTAAVEITHNNALLLGRRYGLTWEQLERIGHFVIVHDLPDEKGESPTTYVMDPVTFHQTFKWWGIPLTETAARVEPK